MSSLLACLSDAPVAWQAAMAGVVSTSAVLSGANMLSRLRRASRPRGHADGYLRVAAGTIVDANEIACRMLGRKRDDVVGCVLDEVFGFGALPLDTASLIETLRDPAELLVTRPGGGTIRVELQMRTPLAPDRSSIGLIVRDVARGKRSGALAAPGNDPAASLPNRHQLEERLGASLAAAHATGAGPDRGVMLCVVEIDSARTGGLLDLVLGDKLMQAAVARMTRCIRSRDVASRLSTDVFCLMQPMAPDRDVAAGLARRLLSELSEPYIIDGFTLSVGVRIGVALSPDHGTDATTLLGSAEAALSLARVGGQNRYCLFEDGMDAETRGRHALVDDLRRAIEADELVLHYQPLCDSETRAVCGYEALLRWHHPVHGPIEPSRFVALAEEHGVIHQLGRWVLETACRAAATWPGEQYVAVNLSPVQMRDDSLPEIVADILRRTGLPATRLELELTETVLMHDIERVASSFRRLRATGVHLALDDFGTGYSSLSYLRRFPFDRVKIDRSFIQALGEDDGADTIVRLIVGLGRSLGMQVTAEGVETEAQLRTLREHRCSHVQGFLLGRPAPRRNVGHRLAVAPQPSALSSIPAPVSRAVPARPRLREWSA